MRVNGADQQPAAAPGAPAALRPPRLSRGTARLHRQLGRRWQPLTVEHGGLRLTLVPAPPAPLPAAATWLVGRWDDQPALLVLAQAAAERLAARLEAQLALVDVADQELAALLLESALQPLIERAEAAIGAAIALERLERGAPPASEHEPIGLRLAVDGGAAELLLLHLPAAARDALLARWPEAPAVLDDLAAPLAFRIGATRLTAGELASLRRGDVVLLEQRPEPQQIALIAGERWHFAARQGKAGLIVATRRRALANHEKDLWTMSSASPPEAAQTAPQDAELDELPITVVFEVGRQEIRLGELRRLGPGATFALGKDLAGAVDVYAGGRRIGQGEVVTIEDEVGVRLIRLFGHE
jgi:type III secretion protein Q